MARPRHLGDAAPISEACLDVRVATSPNAIAESLDTIAEALRNDYPTRQVQHELKGALSLGPPVPIMQTSHHQLGYVLHSADGLHVAQIALDGFTFSRLCPYQSWETLRDRARTAWDTYYSELGAPKIVRLSVRYINRIDVPDGVDMRRYFHTAFELAPELPQQVSNYFLRVQIPISRESVTAILTLMADRPRRPGVCPHILDIDVIRESNVPQRADELWATFDDLRSVKNDLFFASVTEEALSQPA